MKFKKCSQIIKEIWVNQKMLNYSGKDSGTLIVNSIIIKKYKYNENFKYSQDFSYIID